MLSKGYESTEVDRRTWLQVPSGTHWSTSSDTHQVVEQHGHNRGEIYIRRQRIGFVPCCVDVLRFIMFLNATNWSEITEDEIYLQKNQC